MKLAFGILLTAVVLFVFGYIYWMVNPLPNQAMKSAPDPNAAATAVTQQFPESGVYSVMQSGTSAMVIVNHGVSTEGADPMAMARGFIHYLAVAVILAIMLPNGARVSAHVRRGFIVGLAAVVLIEGSDVIWWGYAWGWKLWGAGYHLLVFVIGALVLSKFLPQDPDLVV